MKASLPRRRLIPRWRPVARTLQTSETGPLISRPTGAFSLDPVLFEQAVASWKDTPTAGHLGEVLSFAIQPEFEQRALEVVQQALKAGLPVTRVQAGLAATLDPAAELPERDDVHPVGGGARPFQHRMSALRRILRIAPANVLSLLDFAQLQSAVGKQDAAARTLRVALSLAPHNRLVLRTNARFFVHVGKPDEAHALIAKSHAAKGDPWLMASEIALADAAATPSIFLQKGRRLLKEGRTSPEQIAELAGAIATTELMSGRVKDARVALRLALERPTDNVVAQAMTEQELVGVRLDEPQLRLAIQLSSEAQLIQAWKTHDAVAAARHAMEWHAEEPFSSRPVQFLTTLYSLRGEYSLAAEWVRAGLRADSNDLGLLTNLAFTHAALGQTDAAESAIRKVQAISRNSFQPYLMATEGLVALKRSHVEEADRLYRTAAAEFEKRGQSQLAALCVAYYAKAALEAQHPGAQGLLTEAINLVQRYPSHDAVLLLNTELPKSDAPPAGDDARRLSQWIFDPAANTLTKKSGVTARGAPAVVILPPKKNLP